MSVLVTGAAGSVGQALMARLPADTIGTDIATMDVTRRLVVRGVIQSHSPRIIYHLAGAKHAPEGELDPAHVARVNIDGTLNVLEAAKKAGSRVILSSTCKACDPETAYGASKLIAERAVLNAGGTVVRFHNIPESSGNVFRAWEALPDDAPIPVTYCRRYFTPLELAIELLLDAPGLDPGRYCVDPGQPQWMSAVARRLYPGRRIEQMPLRRGDRRVEPLHAASEQVERIGRWLRIVSPHDPPVALPVAA